MTSPSDDTSPGTYTDAFNDRIFNHGLLHQEYVDPKGRKNTVLDYIANYLMLTSTVNCHASSEMPFFVPCDCIQSELDRYF
jgi:hypothetical protein